MPEDLRRLLARAESDEGEDVYVEDDAEAEEDDADDGELEESFGANNRGSDAGETDINGGQLQVSEFGAEMKQSFIEYSMSVITARALPDVRDGLKPVHRRILYAMNESGIFPNRPHKKSAWTVGEVIGKYHPHGDSAVYDTMVRLAQWFSMRTPLIDGHGNFGNIDGDGAAAMRYTESRLAKPAMELLRDLQKDTRGLAAQLRRVSRRARGASVTLPQPAGQRLLGHRPWAWPPTSRRTTSARPLRPPVPSSITRTSRLTSSCRSCLAPTSPRERSSWALTASVRPYEDRPRLDHHPRQGAR